MQIIWSSEWQEVRRIDADGNLWRVEGECNTDICGAYCCQSGSLYPDVPGPCEHLLDDLRCSFHARGGLSGKPLGCVNFPMNQESIDLMGGRCLLRLVKSDG